MATDAKCFVLMSFDSDRLEVYTHAIGPAAKAAGFECHRADDAFRSEAIISKIIKNIFRDHVIVADISGFNPNVLYELGVAHTVGDKTIIICEKTEKGLPFNLNAYRVIFYVKTIDGVRTHLRKQLESALRDFAYWGPEPTNPVQDFRPVRYAVPLVEQGKLESAIEKLRNDVQRLENEKRRGELRNLMLALPEVQFRHLMGLIGAAPFQYVRRIEFLEELRKLRGLSLIKNKDDSTIGGIPESGDLKQYLEVTDLARLVLEELLRLVTP